MITILHEDADLLVADKPAGLTTIPGHAQGLPTLRETLEAQVGQRLFVVHRLDKAVSGAIVFARHAEAHRHLSLQFEHRHVEKTYLALAHGRVPQTAGTIDAPLRKFGSGRMGVDARRGKPSQTRYRVQRGTSAYTLLHAFPLTGRRHQLRVHFYHLGHPLVGDPLYGDAALRTGYPRLYLHALRLRCTHPAGHPLDVKAPPPPAFTDLVEALLRG
ncbi:MAG: RluA family pseudouridine synthase [Bacteroidota bacterium]